MSLETKEEGSVAIELFSNAIRQVSHYILSEWTGRRRSTRKIIKLVTTQGIIHLDDIKARRQFLNHLGLGLRETEQIEDAGVRNETIKEALEERAFAELSDKKLPLVFRCHPQEDGTFKAWSIVTTDYVEIPTEEAILHFERMLEEKGLGHSKMVKEWDDGKAVHRVYDLWESQEKLKTVGDLAGCGVHLRAGYSGDRSLGLSSHWKILSCTNGMTSNRQVTAFRGIHRGMEKAGILRQLDSAMEVILGELPILDQMVETAKEPIDAEEEKRLLDKILADYPEHIRKTVIENTKKKYANETGLWKLSQALSDAATHYHAATDNYKNELSKEAFKVLMITPKKEGMII